MKQQRVGWVIVTPRGKALSWTVAEVRGPYASRCDGAWDVFADYCDRWGDVPHDFSDCCTVRGVAARARRLGYRAEPVYREVSQ